MISAYCCHVNYWPILFKDPSISPRQSRLPRYTKVHPNEIESVPTQTPTPRHVIWTTKGVKITDKPSSYLRNICDIVRIAPTGGPALNWYGVCRHSVDHARADIWIVNTVNIIWPPGCDTKLFSTESNLQTNSFWHGREYGHWAWSKLCW